MAISAPARDRIGLGAFLAVFGFLLVGKLAILIGPHRPAPHAVWIRPLGAVGYPVVRGFVDQGTAEALPLRLGDSLVAVGDRDLSGAGMLRFAAAMQDVAWHTAGPVPITVGRAGARVTVALDRPAALPTSYLTSLVTMIAYALAAIVIFLRARPTPGARRMVSGLAWYSLFYGVVWDGPGWAYLATVAIALPVGLATPVALTRAFLSFPEEAGTYGPAHRWWPFVLSPLGPALMSAIYGFPAEPPIGTAAIPVIVVVWIFALLGALAVNYRRSGPVGRRRVKWVVYAAYLGGFINLIVIPAQGGFDNPLAQQAPMWTRLALTGTSLLFPGALLIAMLKFDLFDIDRILGATVGYNMLGVVVVGGGFIAVPPLTSAMASTLDINPSVSRTTITLVLAMAVIFAERRVRPYVDRAFFKERFALEQAMKELPERCAAVRKADDLWALAGAELVANVRPASCVVFVSAGDAFVPVFADGDTLPPAVGAGTELAGWIATLGGAARVDARSARIAGPTAAATLANFATVVVVPVHRGGALEAFITLGEKRSGDVYTHTDLTLLTALGKTLSSHMLRFDEAELLEQARRMQARMQRYVPGAIAAAIAEGAELESGEREVSVLFVDIRGYTAYADGRAVTDIFSTVNRYTETVSTIVNDGGGVVVEFNGDGMMAVFGAPRPLPQKERAAVATARRLAEAVPRLHADEPGAPPLTIGVGVATGPAFVGNIEAADRVIWSAIGSTTNLAARLQALTRDRNASVLVDETTHARAGDAGDGFTRHADVPIRGRKAPVTIFAL